MIHKVEEQGFRSNAEKRDQVGSSQRKGVPGFHEEGMKNFYLEELKLFLVKGSEGGWRGALEVPPARTASPRVRSRRVPARE